MANNRKVQGEIDRLLKKINEGMEVYEEVYDKFSNASSQALKERFEGDLKKEIKKLQRLREQIKALLTGGDVKDKKSLETARRAIEVKMEAFKMVERETKTKAFSKEGLAGDVVRNPQDAAKNATASWIKEAIDELGQQIEGLEYDLENEGGRKKKKNSNYEDPKLERMNRSKYHVQKLEQLLRMLENEEIPADEIDAVQDDVQAYVSGNMDEDYVEEFEEVYDCFDLPDAPAPKEEESEEEEPAPKKVPKKAQDTPPTSESKSAKKETKKETPATPAAAAAPAATPAKKAAAAPPAAAAAQVASPVTIPQPKTAQQQQSMAATLQAKKKEEPKKEEPKSTPKTPASPARGDNNNSAPAPLAANYASVVSQAHAHQQSQAAAKSAANEAPTLESLLEDDDDMNDDTFGDDAMGGIVAGGGDLGAMATMTSMMKPLDKTSLPPVPEPRSKQAEPPAATTAAAQPAPAAQAAPAAAPRSQTTAPAALAAMAMLEQSARNLPHPGDSERLKPYIPPNPYKTPSYYPQTLHPSLGSAETLGKFEIEALFFIFYYQPNTYQQYLAAKELKKQSWRYHKRYLTWFQRHNNPKDTTEDFERGAYIYFDYESGWCQRIKNDFTFKYQYLEDELQ